MFTVDLFDYISNNNYMKTQLALEIVTFLSNTGMSARKLAREAGVTPSSVLHICAGTRFDMRSTNADKVRAAMRKLAPHLYPKSSPL